MSIAIKRNFTIPSTSAIGATELYLTSSVASTTIGTGALQVAGGAGISGIISLGGELKLFNGNFYTGFDSAATANTTYIWPATSPSTGTSVLSSDASGNLSWILMSASGSGLTLNGLTATTQYFSTSIAGSGFTISSIGSTHTYYIGLAGNASTGLISSASQTLFGLKTFASGVAITSGTASTNTTTGDLVVSGGVGIGGTVFTNGLNIQNVFTLGSQVFYPQNTRGFSVNENYNPVGSGASHTAYHFTSGVDRTAIYFDLAISNQYTVMFGTYGSSTGNTFVIGSETANSDFEFRSTVGIQPVRLDLGTLLMRINRSGNVSIPASTASISTSSGTLTVTGGVGIGGSLWTSSTNFSSISGVGHSNGVITSGVWSGTAISAVNGGTGIVSYTTGDILYATSSTTLGKIAAGTAGSILTSAGAGSTPYWAVATVGSATGLTLNGLTAATQFFASSTSGSGFTIGSTGSTHTFYIALAGNASTGLISGAAQTIFGLKTFGSGLAITSGTASTNTTTGALTVAGGVGITGQLSVNTIALGTTAVSITPSMIFSGTAGTVITMSVLSDTTLAWEGSSGQLFSIDNNLSSGEIFSVSDISGLPVITASAGQTITLNEFGGFTQVGNGLASTNTTTGALRVIGGVGITGSLYLGSPLLIPSGGTGLTTYTTGDILYASSSTTLARITAGTAGSVLTSAGAGSTPYWALSTGSGGGITLNGLTATTQTFTTSISGSGFTIGSATSTHTFYIGLAGNASTGLISGAAQTIFGLKTFASGLAITSGTTSTSTATGDLIVTGGVGIGGSLWTSSTNYSSISGVGLSNGVVTGTLSGTATSAQILNTTTDNSSTLYILGTRSNGGFAGTSIYVNTGISALGNTITATTFTGSLSGTASSSALVNIDASTGTRYLLGTALNTASGSTQVSVGSGITIGNNLLTSGGIAVTNSTASTSTTSGALVVTGGVGIGASVNIGGKVGINTGVYTGAFNITTPSSSTPGLVVQGSTSQTADYLQLLSSAGATSLRIDKDGKIIFPQQSSIQLFAESYSSTGRIRTSGPMIVYGAISSLSDGINESYLSSGTLYIQGLQWTPYGSPARWSTNNAVRIQPTSTSVVPLVVQLQNASWTSGNAFEIQNNGVLKFNVDYAGNTSILSTTGSGSTSTGALVVSGGVGIGGSLNIYQTTTANDNVLINAAKEIRFYNSSNTFYSGIKAGVTTSSTTFTLPIVDGTANQVLLTNGSAALGFTTALLGLNGLNTSTQTFATSISGSGFTIGSSTSTHTFYIGLAGNASTGLISAASQSLYGAKTFINDTAISSSTTSTSTSTGALTITGGVGIGGSLWTSTTNFSSISGVGHSNSTITSGTWAGNAVSAIYGGTGYTSYTKGDLLAGNGSTFVKLPVGTNNQYLISDSSTGSGLSWYSIPSATYGSFYRTTSQTVAADTATPVIFNSTYESNKVSIFGGAGTSSYIKIDTAGTYNIQFSAQLNLSSGNQPQEADFWFRVNGTDVANSNSRQTVSGKDYEQIITINFVYTFSANQYFEIVMSSPDVHFIIFGTSSLTGPVRPDIPSIILTVTPVMESIGGAGTGGSLSVAGTNNGDIQYKSGTTLGASSNLNFDSLTSTFKITGFPIEAVSGGSANVKLLGSSVAWNGNINGTMLAINTANTFIGDLFNAQIGGTSRFKVSYTGAVSIGNSYTLPITDGTANQVLKTDGAGSVSWSDSVISSAQYNIGYYASAGTALTGSSTFTNNTSTGVVSIGHTTSSTGFSTGALVVSGGVGIGQTLNVSGNIYQNTNAITAYDTGFRNRIINGDGNIDQRNSGADTTPASTANFIDRWKMNIFGSGRLTIGKNYGGVAAPDGFVSYIGMKTTTTTTPGANDYNFLSQIIEGVNTIDLQWGSANAKPITLSFWAYSSLTGTFGGSVRNAGSGGYTRSYPFTYTISSSNTWEKKTIVIPGDTTGTWTTSQLNGLEIIFVVSNGTTWQGTAFSWVAANATGPSTSLVNLIGTLNATLYLTGIQAEIGSVATPYERRNYGHEFALCQRYYQITEVRTGGYHTTGGELRGSGYLSAAMRPIASPIVTVLATDESGNLGTLNVDGSNFRGDSFRYIVAVTTTGTAYGQWKVSCDTEF
jgi:hypothetical protein